MEEEKFEESIKKIKEILLSHGIKMNVNGCGHCGSPTVSFVYKDKVILNNKDDSNFEMIEDYELDRLSGTFDKGEKDDRIKNKKMGFNLPSKALIEKQEEQKKIEVKRARKLAIDNCKICNGKPKAVPFDVNNMEGEKCEIAMKYYGGKRNDMKELVEKLELEINKTPTGELRNLLCDINIMLQDQIRNAPLHDVITKRQYFAGLAMQGILSTPTINTYRFVASKAVQCADELLKQLEQ